MDFTPRRIRWGDGVAKILIIDDDSDFAETTRTMLESAGYDVFTASDGKQGLEFVRNQEPDLIVLDIMMESMYEGFSVMSTLRGTPEFIDFRDIPCSHGFFGQTGIWFSHYLAQRRRAFAG